jgi:hypothetical protein
MLNPLLSFSLELMVRAAILPIMEPARDTLNIFCDQPVSLFGAEDFARWTQNVDQL